MLEAMSMLTQMRKDLFAEAGSYQARLIMLIETLYLLRSELATASFRRIKKATKKADLLRNMNLFEAGYMMSICNERDEAGKPLYPNETLRKSELEIRLARDKDFMDALNQSKKLEKSIAKSQCDEDISAASIKMMSSLEHLMFLEMENGKAK